MAEQSKKCAHPSCNCAVEKGEKYCSTYCEDAGDIIELACNCGHAGCTIGAGQPAMGA